MNEKWVNYIRDLTNDDGDLDIRLIPKGHRDIVEEADAYSYIPYKTTVHFLNGGYNEFKIKFGEDCEVFKFEMPGETESSYYLFNDNEDEDIFSIYAAEKIKYLYTKI